MGPTVKKPQKVWKLNFVKIFGFPLPGQIEYMLLNTVQSLIAESDTIREAFIDDPDNRTSDFDFTNTELVRELLGFYSSLNACFIELRNLPVADLEQNMRDIPDIRERLKFAHNAAVSDMNNLACILDGHVPVAAREGRRRAAPSDRFEDDRQDLEIPRVRYGHDMYRPSRHGRHGIDAIIEEPLGTSDIPYLGRVVQRGQGRRGGRVGALTEGGLITSPTNDRISHRQHGSTRRRIPTRYRDPSYGDQYGNYRESNARSGLVNGVDFMRNLQEQDNRLNREARFRSIDEENERLSRRLVAQIMAEEEGNLDDDGFESDAAESSNRQQRRAYGRGTDGHHRRS